MERIEINQTEYIKTQDAIILFEQLGIVFDVSGAIKKQDILDCIKVLNNKH